MQTGFLCFCASLFETHTHTLRGIYLPFRLEGSVAAFHASLEDGNRLLWTMQRKEFVLGNVERLKRFCKVEEANCKMISKMISYDINGIPYEVAEPSDLTPLESRTHEILQAFRSTVEGDGLVAMFGSVCSFLEVSA